MDKEWVRRNLPEKINPEVIKWARETQRDDLGLGGDYLFYKAVRVKKLPMYDYPWDGDAEPETVWAAQCRCTACRDEFTTAGGANGIYLGELEDGGTLVIDADTLVSAWKETALLELHDNEMTYCPMCETRVKVLHTKNVRGGRTKRLMVKTVERVGEYAAIVHWIIENNIKETGCSFSAFPKSAFVLGERGGFTKYLHATGCNGYGMYYKDDGWRLASNNSDDSTAIYADWGSICNKKCGSDVYPECPDLTGTTGEKTGLAEFARHGDSDELMGYIRLWKQWKPLEAFVVSGFAGIVGKILNNSAQPMAELDAMLDLTQRKPARMLYMDKAMWREYRELRLDWNGNAVKLWARYRRNGGQLGPGAFKEMRKYFGVQAGDAVALGEDLQKVERYLTKQGCRGTDLHLLKDSRNMAQALYKRSLTDEELWPRNLRETHDMLVEQTRIVKNAAEAAKYAEGFREVKEKYGHLEWTDGELSVILPKDNGELVNEGDVLRHCVGGYGQRHIEGKDTIFFIRHYRRPERPYYTLDIRMTDGAPHEVQLHGYGNERHGAHKEQRHSIPKKVRDFCDRWEIEVLQPWWRENQKELKRKGKTA